MKHLYLDIDKAAKFNKKYGKLLGWGEHTRLIMEYLGLTILHNDVAFIQEIANWQALNFSDPDEIDGIIGPATWNKLKKQMFPHRKDHWKDLRARIVSKAESEHAYWGFGMKSETHSDMEDRLYAYYKEGAGKNPHTIAEWLAYVKYKKQKLKAEETPLKFKKWKSNLEEEGESISVNWKTGIPWSAAFVSYVMRKAGAGNHFYYHTLHWEYVNHAKKNRKRRDLTNPFWAFHVKEVLPEPGDIICNIRGGSNFNYYNLESASSKSSHCDIITEVCPHHIHAIGGNTADTHGLKKNTVGKKLIHLDSNGYVKGSRFFALIKVGHGPSI